MNCVTRFASLLLAAAVLCAPLAAHADQSAKSVVRFALVIGANDGGEDRVTLRHAVKDAGAFARVLREMGGVAANRLMTVTEPDAAKLDRAIAKLGKRLQKANGEAHRVELVVYYSGHSDRKGLLISGDAYPYKKLRAKLDSLAADVRLVVLDSCSSGGITRTKGGKRRPPFLANSASNVSGYAILTSSSVDEAAQESDKIGASFFTHYLVSGLRGAADVNTDKLVTLNEAYQFAFHETLARTEKTKAGAQHAAYDMNLSGRGDLVLTDMRQTGASLELGENLSGRVFIREVAGDLAVEMKKVAGKTLTLGLPPGKYEIVLRSEQVHRATVDLSKGKTTKLASKDFKTIDAEEARSRGVAAAEGPDEWTSDQGVSLAERMLLRDGMAESRLGAGQRFYAGPDGLSEFDAELLLRWGISDRLSLTFPLVLSAGLLKTDSSQFVLSGGLSGLGYSSIGGLITSAAFGADYQYLLTPSLALNAGVALNSTHRWGTQSSHWGTSAGAALSWDIANRVSGSLGAGYAYAQAGPGVGEGSLDLSSRHYEPRDYVVLGGGSGQMVPGSRLLQVRVWRGLHLYEDSSVAFEPETMEMTSHRHILGLSWYYEIGEEFD